MPFCFRDVVMEIVTYNIWCRSCTVNCIQIKAQANMNSPLANIVMLAFPIFCPLLSDTTHVYKILVNFTSTVIVSACTDWFDHCHVKFAPDWSVWHVRVMFSLSHSMIPAPNVGVVVTVTFAVATVSNGISTLRLHLHQTLTRVN